MPGRTSSWRTWAVVIAAVAVLVGVMVLVHDLGTAPPQGDAGTPAPHAAPNRATAAAPTAPGPVMSRSPVPSRATITPPLARAPAPIRTAPTSESAVAEPVADVPTPPRPPIKPTLRTAIAGIVRDVRSCIARTPGPSDGNAVLGFIAATKDGKVVIETATYDADESTIKNPALLECLQATSNALQIDALPDGVHAISVGRRVTVKDGALVDDHLTDFSYL